jgi:hypothetical protein
VDVAVSSHEDLQEGRVEVGWFRVLISPDEVSSDHEARLLAEQMAAAAFGMCTSARLVSWPDRP